MLCQQRRPLSAFRLLSISLVVVAAVLGGSRAGHAQASRIPPGALSFAVNGFIGNGGALFFIDAAFDPANKVYFLVGGKGLLQGQFVTEDGTMLASGPYVISSSSQGYAHSVSTTYSGDLGGFLVTWVGDLGGVRPVYGAFVKYNASAPATISAPFLISPANEGAYTESLPSVAYAPETQTFLVTWTNIQPMARGQVVGLAGQLIGSVVNIAPGVDSAVAYDSVTREFLVSTSRNGNTVITASRVQAATGTVLSYATVGSAGMTYLPSVIYNSTTAAYMVFWAQPGGSTIAARVVSADGVPTGNIVAVSTQIGSYDHMDAAYNPVSNTTLLVGGWAWDIGAVEALANGNPETTVGSFQATVVGNRKGAYAPRLTAHTGRPEWLIILSSGYQQMMAQRIRTATVDPTGTSAPTAAFSFSPAAPFTDQAVQFTDTSARNPTSWSWNFGDGSTSASQNPTHAYSTAGSYTVTLVASTAGGSSTSSQTLTVSSRNVIDMSASGAPNGSWVFAEGALGLGHGFSTYYEIANENAAATAVRAWFIREDTGAVTFSNFTVDPLSRKTLDLSTLVGGAAGSYSAVFQSATAGQQIYVGRTMYWGDAGDVLTGAGHLKTGAFIPPGGSPSTNWYFAEGTRVTTPDGTPFQTYFMVFNPSQTAADITVDFLSDDGNGFMTSVSQRVAGQSRWTLSTDGIAPLAHRNFSVRITSSVGIVAERSMYWGANWSAGHTGFGAPTASPDWYFAEGTAQTAFDTYFSLLNPTSSAISVDVTYYLSPQNGVPQTPIIKNYSVPPNSRKTVYLTGEVGFQPGVAAEFHATTGSIVVERSMYWGTSWTEGSTVAGTTTPATEWHLPEGSTEGGFETYLLLSNPNPTDATVAITTFSKDGEQETQSVTVFAKTRLTVYMNKVYRPNETPDPNAPEWATITIKEGKAFSVRVRSAGTPLPIVAEEAVYWNRLHANGQYWRGGDTTMGFPVIK
jgi:PKD repeat protein